MGSLNQSLMGSGLNQVNQRPGQGNLTSGGSMRGKMKLQTNYD